VGEWWVCACVSVSVCACVSVSVHRCLFRSVSMAARVWRFVVCRAAHSDVAGHGETCLFIVFFLITCVDVRHVASCKLFWVWNFVLWFVTHDVWVDKGQFLHCCFVQIASLRSLESEFRRINFTVKESAKTTRHWNKMTNWQDCQWNQIRCRQELSDKILRRRQHFMAELWWVVQVCPVDTVCDSFWTSTVHNVFCLIHFPFAGL